MIRKSLVTFGILCVVYSLLIVLFPKIHASQNQNQSNYIKAEEYLYGDRNDYPVTIVGTSLAARIVTDSLPGFYNLAFGGMSVSDGLAIIEHSRHKPTTVLIETNLFWKENSAIYLASLFNPVNYFLKKFLVSFRSDKQPIAIATATAIQTIKKLRKDVTPAPAKESKEEVPFQKAVFEQQKRQLATLPDTNKIRLNLEVLKNKIETLQSMDINVVFVEMPINTELTQTPSYQYTHKMFRESFPANSYRYVPARSWNFKTTDGLHMTGNESQVFTSYLKKWYQNK